MQYIILPVTPTNDRNLYDLRIIFGSMSFKQEKTRGNQATQFICDRLEDSGFYQIIARGHVQIRLQQHPELVEKPRSISVLMANILGPRKYREIEAENIERGVLTAPVLFKDCDTAFVRLADRSSLQVNKLLKRYGIADLHKILHLRRVEKNVLARFAGQGLFYYQPASERFPESIQRYSVSDVVLDYGHIDEDHPSFGHVRNSVSVDYKFPHLHETITGPVRFRLPYRRSCFLRLAPADSVKQKTTVAYHINEKTGQFSFQF